MKRRAILLLPLALAAPRPVRAAADDARSKVEAAGGLVLEIAQNDDRLEVIFRGADNLSEETLAAVAELPKVAYLRLGGSNVTDAGLEHVGKLTDLVKLNLEQTKISDKGLAHLSGLENLEYLNLHGTDVTDAGLEHLAGLENLKKLYLWQTKVTDEGVAKLEEASPELEVNRGWELPEAEPVEEEKKEDSPAEP